MGLFKRPIIPLFHIFRIYLVTVDQKRDLKEFNHLALADPDLKVGKIVDIHFFENIAFEKSWAVKKSF